MRFIESVPDFFRGWRVQKIADQFQRFMVVNELIGLGDDRVRVSLDYALGLSGSGRRPRVPSGRTEEGGHSYGSADLLAVTISSRPFEGEVHHVEDETIYLMGRDGKVFILIPDSEESSTPPDEGAAERAIFLNESAVQVSPVSASEADRVVSLAAKAVAVVQSRRR